MTQLNYLKSTALISVTVAATMLVIHGCGGDSNAIAQSAPVNDPIEGVWESTVSIKDCASGAVVRTFKGESMFHMGGTLSADNSLPPPTRGAAFGTWKRDAPQAYTTNFRFLRFNADGSLAGSQKVRRSFTLAADNNTFSGTLTGQVIDTAEVVLQPFCGAETAVRIF